MSLQVKINPDSGETALEHGRIADRAIRFAADAGIALTPEAFHVWFVYASRRNETINSLLDTAMNTGARITQASLAEIYLSQIARRTLSDELAQYSDSLLRTMGDTSSAVAQGLDETSVLGADLRLVKRGLGLNASRHDLLLAVNSLIRANQIQQDSARKLETQLDRSRSKLSTLEKELVEIRKSANIDSLTRLPNRRGFELVLEQALFNARQKGTGLALAIAGLDGFTGLNRDWGHEAGDNVLRHFSASPSQILKGRDVVARFGGDIFAIIFPETALADAVRLAEKIRADFAAITWTSQQSAAEIGRLTVSFGLAGLLPHDTKQSLLSRAEGHLQAAKAAGRNQVVGK